MAIRNADGCWLPDAEPGLQLAKGIKSGESMETMPIIKPDNGVIGHLHAQRQPQTCRLSGQGTQKVVRQLQVCATEK